MRQERAGQSPGLRKEWSLPSTGATEEGEDRHPRTRERGRETEAGSFSTSRTADCGSV